MNEQLYVTCTPGLEYLLCKELCALGYSPVAGRGGASVSNASLEDVLKLNLYLRTASRVLLKLFEIEQPTKAKLYSHSYDYNWTPLFTKKSLMPTFAIQVPSLQHSECTNSMYVAQLVKDAICDHLRKSVGRRPSVDKNNPQMQFHVVMNEEKAEIYFDTSLEPLFKRGYRQETVSAPLKETLAAAILMMAGFCETSILLDPCAGSGTFLIEAGLMASNTPPGLFRSSYGFTSLPNYDDEMFLQIKEKARGNLREIAKDRLFGFEQDGTSFRKALKAIAKAGLMDVIDLRQKDFRSVTLQTLPNLLVTNPPFGVRLGSPEQWTALYSSLGDLMKRATAKPAVGAVLSSSPELALSIRLKPHKKIPIFHGGLQCHLLLFDLY
jgi:putative N6-adenine-specific DNA methylase